MVRNQEPEAVAPPVLWYLWEWFGELSAQRSHGMTGPNPIGFAELLAWAAIRRISLTGSEVSVLLRLDHAYLDVIRTSRKAKG